jgi:hypothetical protein
MVDMSASVTWVKLLLKVQGNRMKRVANPATSRRKRKMSKMKIMLPIVVRPRKRWGVFARRSAMPPVDMVRVKFAHVKCLIRSRRGSLDGL